MKNLPFFLYASKGLLLYCITLNINYDPLFIFMLLSFSSVYASDLLPGSIICSICDNTDEWELINKYAKRFVKAGVKLRETSFDTWMKFAAKRGAHSLSFLFDLMSFICLTLRASIEF
jgi:archaellum biogenesis protein FlaJ (TadC family)